MNVLPKMSMRSSLELYKIKQIGTVQEYIDKFCELIDQLQAYSRNTDPIHYTTHFIDGLRDDIKYFIVVQWRPRYCMLP
jgi:hypothetical protein